MKSIKTILMVVAVMGLFSTSYACKRHKKNKKNKVEQTVTNNAKATLNKGWKLMEMRDGANSIKDFSRDVTLQLNTRENGLNGRGPCNSYFGSFTSDYVSTFKATNVGSTKMYCEESMKNEDLFFAHLDQTTAFKIINGKLNLYKGDQLLMVFE
ncbi:MAG TPA: META domain-containing protein [Chitinophagales bacterium]|jgi:heat shock protein HslJ|nr:META domain-containing protein [Chitinophagales bacterium]HQV77222.1 META domain-containing protein [Chitinophagales bacterium]HQW79721.1 META domain-containing protein [Chitinophagales bacterium]HRB19031.1 META domain-containing protein [Chitinophagales bacterium]HRB66376.1 META domain-containing protein [Chitinophagales bacterium]